MTAEEKQQIVSEVLSAIRTNSALITDLTQVSEIPSGSFIELSGGKRIATGDFKSAIQQDILDDAVTPTLNSALSAESTARENADTAMAGDISNLQAAVALKFDKADVVQASGSSTTKVMSQKTVSDMLAALGVKVGNINLTLGTGTANNVILTFTDDDGNSASITLPKATTSAAGVMSAADKAALNALGTDVAGLKDSEVSGVSLETGADTAKIVVSTSGSGSDHEVTIPKAGTVPTGETDPVAGVMSAQQAQDLADVVLEVFPLIAAFATKNDGVFEKGQSITPAATLSVTRRGENVLSEATINTTMTVNENALSYEAVTENTTLNVSVSHKGSTVTLPALQYRFYNYVYGDVLSAEPVDVAAAIAAATTLAELSARTTYNGTLAANKMFLFAVPGNVNLVCRHAETGAIITGCTTGTALVPRQCDSNTTDSYSYIIVPSSDVAWNFKITNT